MLSSLPLSLALESKELSYDSRELVLTWLCALVLLYLPSIHSDFGQLPFEGEKSCVSISSVGE